jgi:hypothetical protein
MIGLSVLVVLAAWVTICVYLTRYLVGLAPSRFKFFPGKALVFVLLLISPFAYEIVGQIQFQYLCERHAKKTLSADWQNVKRARDVVISTQDLPGLTVFSVERTISGLVDIDTGITFSHATFLSTRGGFVRRAFGSLGSLKLCGPPDTPEFAAHIGKILVF